MMYASPSIEMPSVLSELIKGAVKMLDSADSAWLSAGHDAIAVLGSAISSTVFRWIQQEKDSSSRLILTVDRATEQGFRWNALEVAGCRFSRRDFQSVQAIAVCAQSLPRELAVAHLHALVVQVAHDCSAHTTPHHARVRCCARRMCCGRVLRIYLSAAACCSRTCRAEVAGDVDYNIRDRDAQVSEHS